VFRDHSSIEAVPEGTGEGDVRRAFYLSYNDANCEYLSGDEISEKLDAGIDVISATFVTPYPPGFPVLVPGQVFSREILTFIHDLDTPEIHGYRPDFGYRGVHGKDDRDVPAHGHPGHQRASSVHRRIH
jgi:arginine decarboxylase